MIAEDAPLQIFDEIDSTNAEACRRAAAGQAGPLYLLARRQSSGRGRHGRVWESAGGNLFLTYLGATEKPPAEIALLGFAAGVALSEYCDVLLAPRRTFLKWPNDLMIERRKAAGLLLEAGTLKDGRNWFALGLGLNLVSAPRLEQPACALADFIAKPPPSPEIAARDLAGVLAAQANVLVREGFAPLREAWLERAYGLNEAAEISLGGQKLSGKMRGLSPKGELQLELPDGQMRSIAAGDIYFPTPETA